jgi:hypothetical protein
VTLPLAAGLPISIGSLPHEDAAEAVAFILDRQPELPSAPQLPRRSPRERMIAQAAYGLQGVTVDDDGSIAVDVRALDAAAPVDTELRVEEAAGLLAFLDAIEGRTDPIKLQLTGPLTLGLELAFAGAPVDKAFAVAGTCVRAKAKALVAAAREKAPDAQLVVFLDEPGLGACAHGGFPMSASDLIDLLSGSLASIGSGVVTGVHCCAETGWRLAVGAGPDILSLPVTAAVTEEAGALASFLETGGWVAWGAVPTTGPIGDEIDVPWRRLVDLWCELTQAGCEPGAIRRQSLVSPACGLAFHGPSQAERVLRLVRRVAERVQDQAVASRLSVGA